MPVDAVPDQPQDAAIGLFDHPLIRPIGCRHLALGQHIGNALMARHAQRCDPVAIPPSPKAQRWLDPVPLQLCCAVCGVQFHAAAGRVHAPMQVAVRGAQQAFRSCGAGLPMPWRTVFNVAGSSQFFNPDGEDVFGVNNLLGDLQAGTFDTPYVDEEVRISRSSGPVLEQLRVFVREGSPLLDSEGIENLVAELEVEDESKATVESSVKKLADNARSTIEKDIEGVADAVSETMDEMVGKVQDAVDAMIRKLEE